MSNYTYIFPPIEMPRHMQPPRSDDPWWVRRRRVDANPIRGTICVPSETAHKMVDMVDCIEGELLYGRGDSPRMEGA